MAEAVKTHPDMAASSIMLEITPKIDNACEEDSCAVFSMEIEHLDDSCSDKPNSSVKKEYTEEERLKRKAFFDKIHKSRKLAREKYRKRLANNPMNSFTRSIGVRPKLSKNILSQNMSQEDKKMLDFYKVRLSTLRGENEYLHKRLIYLVNENMKFLQMGPPKIFS